MIDTIVIVMGFIFTILTILFLVSIIRQKTKQTKYFLFAVVVCFLILCICARDRDYIVSNLILTCIISAAFFIVYLIVSLATRRSIRTSILGIVASIAVFFCTYAIDTSIESNSIKQIDKDAFKKQCTSISYDTCQRYPEKYKDVNVKTYGVVAQVTENGNSTILRVNALEGVWYVTYDRPKDEPRLLEGDYITCYGICNGVTSYKTVTGAQITIPSMVLVCYENIETST